MVYLQAIELENVQKTSYLEELQKVHREERRKAKRYLDALQRDNEVICLFIYYQYFLSRLIVTAGFICRLFS